MFAGAWDRPARDFATRHAGVALIVPRDLSQPGWSFRLGEPGGSTGVAGGSPFRLADVGGILTRLPAVTAGDLPHIAAHDRDYVAAELTAFLLAVLTRPGLRVANRPTPLCLCGPAWHAARWRLACHRLGLPARAFRARAEPGKVGEEAARAPAQVAVIGGICAGAPDAWMAGAASALAAHAEAEMLTVDFDGIGPDAAVLRARAEVDLDDPRIAAAVLRHFGLAARSGCAEQASIDDPALGY